MNLIEVSKDNLVSRYVEQMAEVHLLAYSRDHLTANFKQPVLEKYYRHLILASELCVLCIHQGDVIGFIVAGPHVSDGVSRFIHEHGGYVLWVMLKHPVFLLQKVMTLIQSKIGDGPPSAAKFRLLSIAVRPDFQSRNVGGNLLTFFEIRLRERGITRYGLSVRSINRQAMRFYEKNGFVIEKTLSRSIYFIKRFCNTSDWNGFEYSVPEPDQKSSNRP